MGHATDGAVTPAGPAAAPLNRRLFVVCALVGGGFIAFGVWSLLRRPVAPLDFAIWFGGGIAVHDLVAAPAVFALGWALRRAVPRWALAPLQAGLIVSAVLIVFTLPAYGIQHNPGNLSRLPNHYLRNLAGIVAVVWVAVLGGLMHARRNRRA